MDESVDLDVCANKPVDHQINVMIKNSFGFGVLNCCAALGVLSSEDREQIGLVIVGRESSLDFDKPIATYVPRFCAISPNCRTFETKDACYGGTAALTTAAHWIASGANRSRKALVATTDQSRAHLGKPWEYALGAGAVAMVVSDNLEFLALDPASHGFWSNKVCDTYRPMSTVEIGNAPESVLSYLEVLDGAYEHFEALNSEVDYDSHFAANVYHTPAGSIASMAHRTLMRRTARKTPQEIRGSFEVKTKPSLTYTAHIGSTYTSSVYLGPLGLIEDGLGWIDIHRIHCRAAAIRTKLRKFAARRSYRVAIRRKCLSLLKQRSIKLRAL